MDGKFAEARERAERARSRAEAAGNPGFATLFWVVVENRARVYLGLVDDDFADSHRIPMIEGQLTLLLTHVGKNEEALELLEKHVMNRPAMGTDEDWILSWVDVGFLEAAVLLGHRHAAELLLNRFKNSGLVTNGAWHPTCIPRHLGGAAALLGRYDEARKYYQQAIKVCTEMPFRPELALSRLQLAELLLEHYPKEKKEALEHLDFAIKEFREMKMQPSLERALRHKDILKA